MTSFAHASTLTSRRAPTVPVPPSQLRGQTPNGLTRYLNDHLADETLRLELVKRAIAEREGTPMWAYLELLSWELEQDRDELVQVMDQLGIRRRRTRLANAWIAGHSPLRPSPTLESLQQGVHDKIAMWTTLRSTVGDRVHGIGFDAIIARAERRADEVERRRLGVAP